MRVTLDLDQCPEEYAWFLVRNLRRKFGNISVRMSSGGEGFHVLIRNTPFSFDETIKMREILGDDEKRIEIDIENHKNGIPHSVLFDEKNGKKSGEWLHVHRENQSLITSTNRR